LFYFLYPVVIWSCCLPQQITISISRIEHRVNSNFVLVTGSPEGPWPGVDTIFTRAAFALSSVELRVLCCVPLGGATRGARKGKLLPLPAPCYPIPGRPTPCHKN